MKTKVDLSKVLEILKKEKVNLRDNFGVEEIAIFGSFARNSQTKNSDMDIMVTFKKGYSTFDNYMNLTFFLEETFTMKIDLITKRSIRKELRDNILREAIYA